MRYREKKIDCCVLAKKKTHSIQLLSPVRELSEDQVLELGSLVTEMREKDLQDTKLSNPGVLAHLGTLTDWSPKKVSYFKKLFIHLFSKTDG